METKFENRKMIIEYIEKNSDIIKDKSYIFKVSIKDFDTPNLNIEYDSSEDTIVRTWIEEDVANIPKSHVVHKIFSLIEYEVVEVIKFMIKHI
ncbi:hypothetical protein [Faecalimicrobium dakarense]|uniref:hypothetical protein n=1 Tax=Faecalimicrobium dakarense TaxID=1301100 RepID=UPI0004ADAF68|nr:hypothetical protein [[Clostridium] dakarense]